jgi:hypothetical protein
VGRIQCASNVYFYLFYYHYCYYYFNGHRVRCTIYYIRIKKVNKRPFTGAARPNVLGCKLKMPPAMPSTNLAEGRRGNHLHRDRLRHTYTRMRVHIILQYRYVCTSIHARTPIESLYFSYLSKQTSFGYTRLLRKPECEDGTHARAYRQLPRRDPMTYYTTWVACAQIFYIFSPPTKTRW